MSVRCESRAIKMSLAEPACALSAITANRGSRESDESHE
jgi:hypothetical protein